MAQYRHMYHQNCIKSSPSVERKRWSYKTGDLLREVQLMKFSMTGQENGDRLIQVTACEC